MIEAAAIGFCEMSMSANAHAQPIGSKNRLAIVRFGFSCVEHVRQLTAQ
jgi:hypothetical protein